MTTLELFQSLPLSVVNNIHVYCKTNTIKKPKPFYPNTKLRPNVYYLNKFNRPEILNIITNNKCPYHYFFQSNVSHNNFFPKEVKQWLGQNAILLLLIILILVRIERIIRKYF